MEILLSVRWEKKYQIIFVRFLWGITQHTQACFFPFPVVWLLLCCNLATTRAAEIRKSVDAFWRIGTRLVRYRFSKHRQYT